MSKFKQMDLNYLFYSLLLVVFFADFFSRILTSNDVKEQNTGQDIIHQLDIDKITKPEAEGILVSFEAPDIVEKATTDKDVKPQLDPSQAIINNHHLELKAIIQGEPTFILINITNKETRKSELKKYFNNDSVFGLSLAIVNNTQIKLSNNKQITILDLYKKNK